MEIKFSDLRPSYDLIIIGSGPAGMTLAHKYEERTGRVWEDEYHRDASVQ